MPQTISRSWMWQQSLENPFISLLLSSSFSSDSARHTCRSTLTTGHSSNLSYFLLQISAATYIFRSLVSFYHGTILASISALSWLHRISLYSQASKHSTNSTGECCKQLTSMHILTSVRAEVSFYRTSLYQVCPFSLRTLLTISPMLFSLNQRLDIKHQPGHELHFRPWLVWQAKSHWCDKCANVGMLHLSNPMQQGHQRELISRLRDYHPVLQDSNPFQLLFHSWDACKEKV